MEKEKSSKPSQCKWEQELTSEGVLAARAKRTEQEQGLHKSHKGMEVSAIAKRLVVVMGIKWEYEASSALGGREAPPDGY